MHTFIIALVTLALAAEGAFRACEPALFDASHRALFKAALLRGRTVDTVFLGSSRHEQAIRPALFDAATGSRSFNLAVSGTSFELYVTLLDRVIAHEGTRCVVAELSEPLLSHAPLPWETKDPIAEHVALVRLRSALRHDSLVRLAAAGLFAARFDGSETMGTEFVRVFFNGHDRACATFCRDALPLPSPSLAGARGGATDDAPFDAEARALATRFTALTARGARVILAVPPLRTDRGESIERTPRFQRFAAAVAALSGAPLYDFSRLDADAIGFADSQHLDARGAEAYTDAIARIVASGAASGVARDAHAVQ